VKQAARARVRAAAATVRAGGAGRTKRAALRQLANNSTAGFLGIEKKFYDTSFASATLSATATMAGGSINPSATSLISTPAAGDGEQNRDGKRIVIKSVQITGRLSIVSTEAYTDPPPGMAVFLALVQDTQTNAAAAGSDLVFKNTLGDAKCNASPLRNLLYASRFKVLKSQVFELNNGSLSGDGNAFNVNGMNRTFNWYLPMELPVNFNEANSQPATTTVANVIDNSLHLMAFATTQLFSPSISYNARIRFMG